MTQEDTSAELSIGDIARQAQVGEGTLRMWEARYGFPEPERLPSGHRRYSPEDLERVRAVLRAREEGLPLGMAIERVRRLAAQPRASVFAALRESFPHLQAQALHKTALIWLSRAIEDECCSRCPHPVLFGAFQHERFYRQSEPRWREMSQSARAAIVLADFDRVRRPRGGPAEVPIRAADPVMREWAVVCDAPELSACMIGWERPPVAGRPRTFEAFWTVEPRVVREAARVCSDLAAQRAPELVSDLRPRLAEAPAAWDEQHARSAVDLATRVALYASSSYRA